MEGLSQNEKTLWSCWEQKSPRDVVREAAAKGTHIELAIKYLMNLNSWNESTAKDWFYAEVKAWTVQLLMRKQIFKVLHVLNKAKLNPENHLMNLAQTSSDIEYRDFILEHLEKLSKDIKSENLEKYYNFKCHWNLLKYLEKSFESEGTFKQNKVFGVGKDRIIVNETEIKHLTIEMIEKYPQEWKSKIATTLFFDSFDFSLLHFSSPLEVWNHLVEQNKAMILVRWINIQMSEVVRDMNARYIFFNNENFVKKLLNVDSKGSLEVLDKLDEIFRKWSITNEMIENVAKINCFAYTKMCIYDTLCSYGIVNEDERNNLYQIVARLARTQNLKLIDDIFTESCSNMTKRNFYIQLATYCVRNKLYKVLTMCVEGNVLDTDLTDVDQEAKDCIELWLLFKSIETTADRQSHVVPVYKTCQQIAKDDIDNYISSNPHLVLGMILLEENAKLFDIFSNEEVLQFKDFKLPNKGYKDKLPHLHHVYKKYADINQPYETKDVNVYQLLSGYRGLDVSKIFEFQLVNQNTINILREKSDRRSLGSLLSEEVVRAGDIKALSQRTVEMPDFANDKLMKRYGYVAKLNHIFYLKQYRPCNASQAFVAQQYQTYNRLQDKSIKGACCEAHALALQNWSDPAMPACAISFVAMIGCNPTRCRVHMSAVKMIKQYMTEQKGLPEDKANKIINEYVSMLIQNNDNTAREILQYLEEITMLKIKEKHGTSERYEMSTVLYESQTMVKFAVLHNLPLPEMLLREFIKNNSWFNFLLFGDVFRYPLAQMLQLSQEFEKKSYSEHLKYIMLHKNTEDSSDNKANANNGQRRMTRLSSVEMSPTQSNVFEFPSSTVMGRELWEVAAACHGPEDPPAALLRAADLYREPLLVLIASCYEPNAVDVLWAQWVISSLDPKVQTQDVLQTEIGQQQISAEQFQHIAETCLREGYVTTLHESMLIFMPESPLCILTSFLCRCIRQRVFDSVTNKLLSSFVQHCQRKISIDSTGVLWQLPPKALQRISVALVKIALGQSFDSAFHQREFLKCLSDRQFGKGFLIPSPNFIMIYNILEISMETSSVVNISKMLEDDIEQYLSQCIEMYITNQNYDVALKIAKLSGLSVNNILSAEWTNKYITLFTKEDTVVEDKDLTFFIAECSEAFKKAAVTFNEATQFLIRRVAEISNPVQQFYAYRIILHWFEDNLEYGRQREEIEHKMWDAYFRGESSEDIFLNSYQSTMHFILNGQKDATLSKKIGLVNAEKPFSMLLREIEIESDVGNIEDIVVLEVSEAIDSWRKVINQLLELKLLVDAFRLSALFKTPSEYRCRTPPCPVQIIKTCLKLAEGTCSPYELPQELRLVISSPLQKCTLSISGTSDASFEELVVIQEKQDGTAEGSTHLAAREEADRLSALEALAARSGLTVAKQIASYFRISLQIGWNYTSVLKYQSHSVDFINFVSGRARMSLANLVFRTFNIPSKEIAEYLCLEMVAAIISPHLVKTSTFKQKEHFQYTLWGYALNSDIEMFLNMRPDACSSIGRLILDHLMAFRRIYKAATPSKLPENTLDDSCLDIETLIDEEYHLEGDEAEVATEGGTLMSAETESMYSVSTVYSVGNRMTRETRRNLFDVVMRSSVYIRQEVKSNIRKITKGAKLSTKQVNIISIELLVLAHECFSSACDTEGVAVVLRSAQALSTRLLAARSWRLMVRLLTGLARYTEMAYVFQALRDNHQFEFLLGQIDYMLGQQPDKVTEFKQGLLDFLKIHCPGDTETYIMVSLHFNMYAEAANVKRKQAMDLIDDLERMALNAAKATSRRPFQPPVWLQIHDSVPTRSLLETALNHCTDAAELYLQGRCTGLAGEMAALAQQIALQMSLLNASPTRLILNRTTEETYRLVSEYLSFMEGLVLLAGRGGEAWRELAYRRALANDQAYLRDMAAYRPDVAHQILSRYKTEKKKNSVSQTAMTELHNLCR